MNNKGKKTLEGDCKKNGMVSLLEGTQQLDYQPDSVKVSNNPLKIGLAKLSRNMTNVCGIRMRYDQNVDKSTLHSLLVLNPECQIKVLEKNLKFLFQEDSTYNYFQIKSNHLSVKTGSKYSATNANEPNTLSIYTTESAFPHKDNKHEIHFEKSKSMGTSDVFNDKILSDRTVVSDHPSGLSSKMLKDTNRMKNKRILSSAGQFQPFKPFFDQNGSEECDIGKKDADNQYEFTVEQEKIVSFVCSTSPPRKQTAKSVDSGTEFSDDQTFFSDHDSDGRSKLWTKRNGESDSFLSENACNTLYGNNKANSFVDIEYLSKCQQITNGSNTLLWHPPSSLNNDSLYTPKAKQLPYPATLINLDTSEPVSNIRVSSDSAQKKIMESSFSRETTLFRETSLRGCFNMENIVKTVLPPQTRVQQELKKVKESIFSAVRSQQSTDDLVSDSILSILDICKSWIKLSSHLKGKEFINILESNGIDLSILNDFLQWQCVSRVFIDKMIDTLQKITPKINGSNVNNTVKNLNNRTPTDVKNCVYSPGLLSIQNGFISTSICQSDNDLSSCKCESNPNKNWKQRRFLQDQPKQLVMESQKTYRTTCPTSTSFNNCSQTHSSCGFDMLYGQGDQPLSYSSESHCCKLHHSFPLTNCFSGQGDVSFPPNSYSILQGSVSNSYQPDKATNFPCTSKSFKHLVKDRSGTKSYQTPITSNLTKDIPSFSLPMNSQATTTNFAIVPPLYNSQLCYTSTSNNQFNHSQFTAKQNPIQCADIDVVEKCTKSSYMKPGSYNIPEKPIGFQKIINNNIPIEDSPVVGVPFLFSDVQGSILSPKSISSISGKEKQVSIEDDGTRKSEEKWKAAMSSAETFRDNFISFKADSGPNLKLSDTVSSKTHFLLSDEFSQGSSSNDFKMSSESEDLSPCECTSPAVDVSIVEAKVKTSDWLMQSFNKAVLENEKDVSRYISHEKKDIENDAEIEVKDRTNINNERLNTDQKDGIHSHKDSPCSFSNSQHFFQHGTNEKMLSNSKSESSLMNVVDKIPENNDASLTLKKVNRNNKKLQDDPCIPSLFDHRSPLFRRKAKSIFKRAITKPISSKLEDILNCICSTEVSSLVEFDCKSEKEVSKLEIKVRCPLYLQAMRCKLANHSYDTLDQALCDFQKYFMDIRNRNKGDKQSTDVVGALEHLFLDLVEKHFGSGQPSPQCFSLRDLPSTFKPRKSKKILRRC